MGAHPLEQVEAVAVGQPHIRETQIERLRFEEFLGAGHVARRLRRQLHARQRQRDQLDQIGLVIHHQHRRRGHG
jgi:hypothetical protein